MPGRRQPLIDFVHTGYDTVTGARGWTATCRVCGWVIWHQSSVTIIEFADKHHCRHGDRCLICGWPYRLGDGDCEHYISPDERRRS